MEIKRIKWNQIAVGNYTYPLFPFSYFLESMERLNVENIELWAAGPHLYLEDLAFIDLVKMEKEIYSHGLKAVCFTPEQCMYPINIGAEEKWIRDRSVRYFEKGLEATETLGIKKMIVTPGNGYRNKNSKETRKYTVDNLRYLADRAKEKDITLLLEHLTKETTNLAITAKELKELNWEVARSNLVCMVDTDMMSRYGESIYDYMDVFNGEIHHVHLVDGMPGGHLAIGDGCLPIDQFWKELEIAEYKEYISLEITNDRYHLNPDDAVRKSLEWISQKVEK